MFSKLTYRFTFSLILLLASPFSHSTERAELDNKLDNKVEQLEKPMYSPFIERYMLDDIKQLRIDQAQLRVELIQQITDREHQAIDRAVSYATDSITYFFYLIAACSSLLVLIGWNSMREIKEKVQLNADEQIKELVELYESRLSELENTLYATSREIKDNKGEIELTQEVQALWLRAQQDHTPMNQIKIYDQILAIKGDDIEALTYKADAVLELGEPQWAMNLCQQALDIDEHNSHAHYQLACAFALQGMVKEAIDSIKHAISLNESYRFEIAHEPNFQSLVDLASFKKLVIEPQEQKL